MTASEQALPVIFFGTPDFSVPTLRALISNPEFCVKAVVTQPDKPAGRGKKMTFSPVKTLALSHNIPVLQPQSIRKEEQAFLKEASALGPFAIGVVIAFGQILPVSVLELPKAGCVNIHASLLPRWRGAAPLQRAIMAGDKKSGVCLMRMEAGLDTGPVFSRAEITLKENETLESLHDALSQMGADLLNKELKRIASGQIVAQEQAQEGITYASKISAEEALIDWSKNASELSCSIRGLSPFPGAFTFLNKQRLKVLMVKNSLQSEECGQAERAALPPGTICAINAESIEVQCGQGTLLLLEVQLEGKKRMSCADFLRGVALEKGALLSSKVATE